jgi:pimeloyl-CoA synthetase
MKPDKLHLPVEFGMFRTPADLAVKAMMEEAISLFKNAAPKSTQDYLNKQVQNISEQYPEIFDTMVKDRIISCFEENTNHKIKSFSRGEIQL